jgi:hypothetical protein
MDFIKCLSGNLVVVLDGKQRPLPLDMPVRQVSSEVEAKSRGLCFHERASTTKVPHRFQSCNSDLKMLEFLHVLDLEGSENHLGSLIHLRYLDLRAR